MNTRLIEFLTANPNSNKGQIADAINLRGLGLFNLLKKMVNEGQITVAGEGNESTYSIASSEEQTRTQSLNETLVDDETTKETIEAQTGQSVEALVETMLTAAKKQVGRNIVTFRFNGTGYNKGKLIHAVVSAYCSSYKNITHEKLKEVFPDTLLKRFGIFQTVEKAREISGAKYDRYFFKDEFQIKLKDAVIVICNQITSENILPFLSTAATLGYVIEAE